jgi:hypothetical protein
VQGFRAGHSLHCSAPILRLDSFTGALMTIRFCFLVLSFSVLLNVPLNAFLDDGDSDKFIFTKDSSRAGNPIIKIRTTKGRPIIDEQAVESLAKNKELIELDLSYARLVRPGVLKNLKGLKQLVLQR